MSPSRPSARPGQTPASTPNPPRQSWPCCEAGHLRSQEGGSPLLTGEVMGSVETRVAQVVAVETAGHVQGILLSQMAVSG